MVRTAKSAPYLGNVGINMASAHTVKTICQPEQILCRYRAAMAKFMPQLRGVYSNAVHGQKGGNRDKPAFRTFVRTGTIVGSQTTRFRMTNTHQI